jgi:hypothetical protein
MHPQLTRIRLTNGSSNSLHVSNLATGLYIFYLIPLSFLYEYSVPKCLQEQYRTYTSLKHVFNQHVNQRGMRQDVLYHQRCRHKKHLSSKKHCSGSPWQWQCTGAIPPPSEKDLADHGFDDLKHTSCLADQLDQ